MVPGRHFRQYWSSLLGKSIAIYDKKSIFAILTEMTQNPPKPYYFSLLVCFGQKNIFHQAVLCKFLYCQISGPDQKVDFRDFDRSDPKHPKTSIFCGFGVFPSQKYFSLGGPMKISSLPNSGSDQFFRCQVEVLLSTYR